MLTVADKVGFPHRREIIMYVLAVVPFIVHFSSVNTVNGRIISYSDFADVVLGAVLLVLVFRNRVFINEGEEKYKLIRTVLFVVLLIVGAYHIASGLGLLIDLPYPLGYGE